MPGGGREHRDIYEEYEAFPGLEWPYRPQTVTHEDFFRAGGSDDFCFPEAEGLEIIRRVRTYREAHSLYVPNLPDGFFDMIDAAELTRDQKIVHAIRTYPADGRRTKRQGWPYLRDLRKHAGIGDIKAADRKRVVAASQFPPTGGHGVKRWTFGVFLALLLLNTACADEYTDCGGKVAAAEAGLSLLEDHSVGLQVERDSLIAEVAMLQGLLSLAHYDENRDGRITCAEAERHGITPVREGHPAFVHMDDRNNDGVVCR